MKINEKIKKIFRENEYIKDIERVDTAVILKILVSENYITDLQAKEIYKSGINFSTVARQRAYIQNELKEFEPEEKTKIKRGIMRESVRKKFSKKDLIFY